MYIRPPALPVGRGRGAEAGEWPGFAARSVSVRRLRRLLDQEASTPAVLPRRAGGYSAGVLDEVGVLVADGVGVGAGASTVTVRVGEAADSVSPQMTV
ncbi:hypothetical protein SAMN06295885_3260 [Rathayibacter oskolensis]|uniref:Uncharacterized protein n=1 Tax=Rathayibacter oskolensis TaxID=1891671 RepID=A0A1X7PD77_9MICO|nr:hypothetical protein SAMN06295885_3260 [Rathayibacter oskolensis]